MASGTGWLNPFMFITITLVARASTVNKVTYPDIMSIVVGSNASSPAHGRFRREITQDMTTFNHEEQVALLRKHNEYRRRERASNMQIMVWNDHIAASAQNYAEECIFEHSTNDYRSKVPGFRAVGENLFAQNIKFDLTLPVKMWYDEIVDYNFRTRQCTPNKMCGHYTQVVWATSNSLGCGVKYCPVLKGASLPSGYHVVCQYGPAGNYMGRDPYIKGKPCSKCEKSMPYCIKGLCSPRPAIGSTSSRLRPDQHSVYLAVIATLLQMSYCIDYFVVCMTK